MQKYKNILFVSTGMSDESDALKQALSLARNNDANLAALIIHPKFPAHLASYEQSYQQILVDKLSASIREMGKKIGVPTDEMTLTIEAERKNKPTISIIKHALKGSFDLVIKQAEQKDSGQGFKALDMDLLRQSPCPVWLCRPIKNRRQDIQIAVAIDAESDTEEGRDLSIQLLKTADTLAKDCNNVISIISCWDYEFEDQLKHNPWVKMSAAEVTNVVAEAKDNSINALNLLIKASNIDSGTEVHKLRGRPENLIPKFIKENAVDILVMGTVARSGISGFIIGNTAENIMQKVGCSLLALKPNGFVSPVKAY